MHKFIEKLKGRFWLLSGVIIYLSTAISSIYRSLDSSGLGSNLYMAVDWLAACIIYFFFGAMIGFALDWFMSGKSRKKYGTPWWLILTVYLWLLSSLVIALVNKNEAINMWLIIFFPLAFGVFYSGFAFTLLSPKAFEQSFYGKLVFDILFISIFSAWIYLESIIKREDKRKKILRNSLLILIFIIFLLGFYGCASALAR